MNTSKFKNKINLRKWIPLILSISIISFLGCKKGNKKIGSDKEIGSANSSSYAYHDFKTENEKWARYINSKSDSIEYIYAENAIKVLSNDPIISGSAQIKRHLQSTVKTIQSIHTDTVILANQKRQIEYELGGYMDQNQQKHTLIIIWETQDLKRRRVFEFATPSNATKNNSSEIEKRRIQWVSLCNAHNAQALINEMYSVNTLYFNHKPLIKGRSLLTEEYAYMNNENYTLSLTPIIVESVNQNFVFELGQCQGSYNGKYIIIWQKNNIGKWEVFIDSNI